MFTFLNSATRTFTSVRRLISNVELSRIKRVRYNRQKQIARSSYERMLLLKLKPRQGNWKNISNPVQVKLLPSKDFYKWIFVTLYYRVLPEDKMDQLEFIDRWQIESFGGRTELGWVSPASFLRVRPGHKDAPLQRRLKGGQGCARLKPGLGMPDGIHFGPGSAPGMVLNLIAGKGTQNARHGSNRNRY